MSVIIVKNKRIYNCKKKTVVYFKTIIMINRIKQLMELKGVSVASFAELLDVNRSSFNHYFSGRSQPSLELIIKILKLYPDISSDWLILGKGELFRNKNAPISIINSTPLQVDENNQINMFATTKVEDSETMEHKDVFTSVKKEDGDLENSSHSPSQSSLQSQNNIDMSTIANSSDSQCHKIIKKIIFFYEDNTFDAYLPT